MVLLDKLTKVAHFIPVNTMCSTSDVAQVFIRDVVRLHGVPKKIVSNKDATFTCKFSKELHVWAQSWPSVQIIIRRLRGSIGYWRTC